MPLERGVPLCGQSFLTEDLCFQYADFYAWMLRVFRGEASLLHNPYTGMGTNAWGIFS
ncbi:MAG: hypothetical protein Q4B54_00130 [Coriobacteriales bacterium]|nr:hypothetical protein [Coriobacteriales bacterium]